MEKQVRRTSDVAIGRLDGEDGAAADQLMVRALLSGLPKVGCPAGFEYRLQRRIAGDGETTTVRGGRNWALGWAGAGLGFAAALIVAIVAFDFELPGVGTATPMAGGPVLQSAAPTPANHPVEAPPTLASEPSAEGQPATVVEPQKHDSAANRPPATLPEGLYHMAGGNGSDR